jgi:hypothetical protein
MLRNLKTAKGLVKRMSEISAKNLKTTKPVPGQEHFAYVNIMVKEPKNNIYGVMKVLCTGPTEEWVTDKVHWMFNEGLLEKELPGGVKYGLTGQYGILKGGIDENDNVEVYNTATREVVGESDQLIAEKRKAAAKELQDAERRMKEESKEAVKNDPDSFDTYSMYRGMYHTAATRVKQLEGELEHIKKLRNKAAKNLRRIEQTHANYKLKYGKVYDQNPEVTVDEADL